MDIQTAIQQKKPFRNAHHKVTVNLIYTHNWVKDQIKQELKPFGITMQQFNVLRILKGEKKPITTSTIRARLLDKMSDASRMVERLYQKELLVKHICAKDKRLVDVALSEKGQKLLVQLESIESQMDGILKNLSEKEAIQLSSLLDKIR